MNRRIAILSRGVHVRASQYQLAGGLIVPRPDCRMQRCIAAACAGERSHLFGVGPAGLAGQVGEEVLKVHGRYCFSNTTTLLVA